MSLISPSCPWLGAKRPQRPKCPKRGILRLPHRSGLRRVENGRGSQVHQSLPLVTGRVLNWRVGLNPKNDFWRFRRGPSLLHSPAEPTAREVQTTQRRLLGTNTSACNVSDFAAVPFVRSGPLTLATSQKVLAGMGRGRQTPAHPPYKSVTVPGNNAAQ